MRSYAQELAMDDALATRVNAFDRGAISRRQLLRALGIAAVGLPLSRAIGQGQCGGARKGTPACDTTSIKPLFEPTGWNTVALDHLSMQVADYEAEAAFFSALVGWKVRSDDGTKAVLDIGDWGTMIVRGGLATGGGAGGRRGGGGGGGGGGTRAVVDGFCWGIEPWDAKRVEAELRKRGLSPVAENDGKGFESFHVKDPDGFDLQVSNAAAKTRRATPANGKLSVAAPFDATGWTTVWLDHISFSVTNYKESVSFYTNLLGWKPTYDEGSQNECQIGDIGDIIIRGGNSFDPNFGRASGGRARQGNDTAGGRAAGAAAPARRARIDHISFGIQPWDTDKVADALASRSLRARADTGTSDDIHVAAYKSYHTTTPNGYDLQLSAVTKGTRQTLPDAVKPPPRGS
jgi:catechol 2,3-dioxygenase-like lactoylglutathione lyase family enzyme